jgi:hypothetical protein
MNIINNNDFTLSASAQQAIEHAAVNMGIEGGVSVKYHYPHGEPANLIDVFERFDGYSEYRFTIDTDDDSIFEA